jgi:hypothetical protein
MKIAELFNEQQLTIQQQIARDTELMTQHMLKQRQQQQSQQAPQQSAPAIKVTPDMIAKHPKYKEWYDKYLAIELPKSAHRAQAEIQAKKYADSKIGSLIRAGK